MNLHKTILNHMKIELWNQSYLYWDQVQSHEFDIADEILDAIPIYDYSDAYIDKCREEVEREINDILSSDEWHEFCIEYLSEKNEDHERRTDPARYYGCSDANFYGVIR